MELYLHGLEQLEGNLKNSPSRENKTERKCPRSLKKQVNTAGKNILDKELQPLEGVRCSCVKVEQFWADFKNMLAQAVSSVPFTMMIVSVKLTLPKITMHFSTFKYSLAAAAPIFYSVFYSRQGITHTATGAASKVRWATAKAAAAEPTMTRGLPQVSDDQSTHTANRWKNVEHNTSLIMYYLCYISHLWCHVWL